jgi:ATP-dependent helicase/nuclease subunit A
VSHTIVRAGAGAGKTYTLTHKVMDIADEIYRREKRWPRIVVTTFTRKATQELRERLMLLALEEKPHLVEFINSRSHLVVSTIHGVMDLFLKRYGSNVDLDPGSTVISGAQASKLARQVLRQAVLAEGGDADLLETLPFNQLVKLMRRLANAYGEDPEAKPFTLDDFQALFQERALKVARELESAAFNIKEETTKEAWLKMADEFLVLAGMLKRPSWGDAREEFTTYLSEVKSAQFRGNPVTDVTNEDAKNALKNAKAFLKPVYDPTAWKHFVDHFEILERVGRRFHEDFRRVKRERGLLEIGDLELLAMDVIRRVPEAAEAFASEWDHWLIDEYQDTSPFQVALLRSLTGDKSTFVVGDPQQSIYLFRGARSEVFGEKETEILEAGGEQKRLTVNRRSDPELLLFLNDFFSDFTPMEPFLEEGGAIDSSRLVAEIFIAPEPLSEDALPAGKGSTFEDTLEDSDDADDGRVSDVEMKAVVAHIQKLLLSGARSDEICVLGRTNQTLTAAAEWLTRYGIPTHVHAAAGFFERRETRDALAFLKFLINPHDSFNLIEVLRSPSFKVSDQLLAEIAAERPESLWLGLTAEGAEAFLTNPSDQTMVHRLSVHLQNANFMGLTGAFRGGLIESGFIDVSHVHDSSGRRESNIWKLLARLESEEARAGFNPLSFVSGTVAELKLEDGNAEGDAVAAVEPDRVNLMTIHASKGLEFKHVVLPRMDVKPRLTRSSDFFYDAQVRKWATRVPFGDDAKLEKTLPEVAYVEAFQKQELDEHARVLYVALTRAISSVFLSWTEPAGRDSWAERVRLDLARGEHKTKNYTYYVSDTAVEPAAPAHVEKERSEPRKKWKTPGEIPAAGSVSVTEILERRLNAVTGANDRDITRRLKVAATGTSVHKLMEILKYPSQERMQLLIERWFPEQGPKVLKAIEFVRRSDTPGLMSIIEGGEVEWGFAVIDDGTLFEKGLVIEGTIDLWGRDAEGRAWIVDYKTGSPLNAEKAFEQMAIYTYALRKSGLVRAEEGLRLAAVFPFAEKILTREAPKLSELRSLFPLA